MLCPLAGVLAGFTPITTVNRRVLLQEWLAEAVTMWGPATVIIVVTATGADTSQAAWVYRVAAGLLVVLTGARTPIIWFKICPVILTASAALLVTASIW